MDYKEVEKTVSKVNRKRSFGYWEEKEFIHSENSLYIDLYKKGFFIADIYSFEVDEKCYCINMKGVYIDHYATIREIKVFPKDKLALLLFKYFKYNVSNCEKMLKIGGYYWSFTDSNCIFNVFGAEEKNFIDWGDELRGCSYYG